MVDGKSRHEIAHELHGQVVSHTGRILSARRIEEYLFNVLNGRPHTKTSPVPVPPPPEPPVLFPDLKAPKCDWEAVLERHGDLAQKRRDEDPKQYDGEVDLSKHKEPVIVMQMSDVHIGSPQCDVNTLIAHCKLIKNTPNLYCILDGDATEWAISPRMLDAVLGQVGSPQEQVRVLGAILEDLGPKIIAFVTGNHDERGFRMGGVDAFEFLIAKNKKRGVYLRDGGVLRIKMAGGITYTWRVSHGDGLKGNSMYSNTAALSRNARHEIGWCDVLSAGHTHDPEMKMILEPRSDGVPKQPTVLLRSGTYKTLGDEQFTDRMGFNRHPFVVMPAVILHPHKKRMDPFFTVEQAVENLP